MNPQFALAQNLKVGQTFVFGRGGKHWTATADASTSTRGEGVVFIPVTWRGVAQGMPVQMPIDKTVKLVTR